MKKQILFFWIIFIVYTCAYGFGNRATHPALTEKTIAESVLDSYLKTELDIDEGINTELQYNITMYDAYIKKRMEKGGVENPSSPSRTISKWVKAGSTIEDEDDTLLKSIRARHHFLDPIHNAGLDNKIDHPNYSSFFAWLTGIYTDEFDATGQLAKTWAIEGIATQEPSTNNQSWNDARDNFYQALTTPNESWRGEYLAAVFLDLGCILHMIEDMGVPAHTRNDFLFAHYQPPLGLENPFEGWVEKTVSGNGGQSLWSGSAPTVFDKLADYFDANVYSGAYLEGGFPPDTWGLSECTNYQFLSLSTVFRNDGSLYVFPHPAKDNAPPNLLEPAPGGKKVYFNGSNYGPTHLARESYTYYVATGFGYTDSVIDSTITTDDVHVFEDYADITIPRTIDYATGLTNYFFRGRLSAEAECIDCNVFEVTITNESSNSGTQQSLKGGVFELYWDDSSGNRTKITGFEIDGGWGASSTLVYGANVTGAFTKPDGEAAGYILIYKGNICANPADLDPDDKNAIAVCKFEAEITANCCEYACQACSSFPDYIKITFSGLTGGGDCPDPAMINNLNNHPVIVGRRSLSPSCSCPASNCTWSAGFDTDCFLAEVVLNVDLNGSNLYDMEWQNGCEILPCRTFSATTSIGCSLVYTNELSYGGTASLDISGNYTQEDLCNQWWPFLGIMIHDQDFDLCDSYFVSGRVTKDGFGVAGVTMDGLGATTDSDGFYSGMVFNGWSGTVTPTKPCEPIEEGGDCTFTPVTRSYSNITSNQEDQDYTAECPECPCECDTNPPTPVLWEIAPYETGSGTCYANMTATAATDASAPVEYYFECVGIPSINSGWTTSREWNNVPLPGCGQFPYFHFKVRDDCGNTSGWSTALPCY